MLNLGNKENELLNLDLDNKGVNNLRGIALDMIANSLSGDGGIALGTAEIIYTLFKYHMNIDLDNLDFINRDRFILSIGHAAPLLYGIDYFLDLLTIDDLKNLKRIGSKIPLVEFSGGLFGQGIGTSVGVALSREYLNKKTNGLLDYYTYVLCGDGELEEGITYEALSLAGTWNLNKLIILLDSNEVTLDNSLKTTTIEDIQKRFESINFNVIEIESNIKNINDAIISAKNSSRPTIIVVKTKIGYSSNYERSNLLHNKILTNEEILEIKEKLGLLPSNFTVNKDVIEDFRNKVLERGKVVSLSFQKKYQKLEDKTFIDKLINHENTFSLKNLEIDYNEKDLRDLSQEILNYISLNFDLLIGGSTDLSSSCKTYLNNYELFSNSNQLGRNIAFGIREEASGAIINGMALLGFRPFVSTFLAFSDYMRPSIRESAMMNLGVFYIFTHDSVLVEEGEILHKPIEQLPSLELIPNLKVYRPFDLNELIGCYIEIFKNNSPSCLILPKDNKNISLNTKSSGVELGIYEVLKNETEDYINLISNGEELEIVLNVAKNLKEIGIDSKVFSVPCKKNIDNLSLLNGKKTIAITLSSPEYFYDLTQNVIGISTFGELGTKEELLEYFGFTEQVLQSKILELLNK